MATLVSRIIFHLIVPLLAFLFVGVPLETYVRGLSGLFSASENVSSLIQRHLFLEAAACFYCITILLEIVVIVYRPHIRTREGLPVKSITASSLFMAGILTASYVWIRTADARHDLDLTSTRWFLVGAIVITAAMALMVHAADFFSSSEVAPCPKPRKKTGAAK